MSILDLPRDVRLTPTELTIINGFIDRTPEFWSDENGANKDNVRLRGELESEEQIRVVRRLEYKPLMKGRATKAA